MKIAVIGGGIFGITSAVYLAREGHNVHLFERHKQILQEASGINQFRLHRGYHYPRCSETVKSLLMAEKSFRREYGKTVIDEGERYYCLAKKDSLTSGKKYLDFCRTRGLDFDITPCALVDESKIEFCIRAKEGLLDPKKLFLFCTQLLDKNNVKLHTNKEVVADKLLKTYDMVVVATYSNQNQTLSKFAEHGFKYQYELCEKPVVTLPKEFDKKSIIVMDGPFMCVDPYGSTGYFLLGNVVHAIHHTEIKENYTVPARFRPLLNRGIIRKPNISNFDKFIKSGSEFIPMLSQAKYVGSMFTVRTVLPNMEDTDSRPTKVSITDHRIVSIFSGKIANCVEAADQVVKLISLL